MSDSSKSVTVALGVLVGFVHLFTRWWAFKIPLSPGWSALIIGAFSGMAYSISYWIYSDYLRDDVEFKRQLKVAQKSARDEALAGQRQQQMENVKQQARQQVTAYAQGAQPVIPQSQVAPLVPQTIPQSLPQSTFLTPELSSPEGMPPIHFPPGPTNPGQNDGVDPNHIP